ncbi:MAG: hypothetical protein DRZ79_01235 [Candidatus Cloacimonadota bacterium]|nr:MAG: hypothetical protein DRZ79_01235 [Candidatus Cloacimonadota bacterium]
MKILIFIGLAIALLTTFSCDKRNPVQPYYYIASLTAEPDTIYADMNETSSEITAVVRDQNDNLVAGETVHFDCDLGHIIYNVPTDEFGKAVSTFWDAGDVGLATITASIDNSSETVEVMILEPPKTPNLKAKIPQKVKN